MVKDYPGLQAELETNIPRYDAAVRAGNNSTLVDLLNEDETGQTIAVARSSDDVREAIGDGIRGLTAAQIQTLRLMIPENGEVDFSRVAIRDEIREVLDGKTAALARLQTLATRTRTYGEAFGFERVSLNDVRQVVRLIAKSFIVSTGQV